MSSGTDINDRISRVRVRMASVLEPLLRVDGRHFNRLFSLFLTAFVATVLVLTLTSGWGWQTQVMPLIIGVPTLLMLLGLLAVQFSSRVATRINSLVSDDVLGMEDRVQEMQSRTDTSTGTGTEQADEFSRRMNVFAMSFWVLLLFVLTLTIGFTVGILTFLLLYYRIQAKQSWIRTMEYTIAIWVFVVVIFIYVLNAPLYPGLLGVHLPFLS